MGWKLQISHRTYIEMTDNSLLLSFIPSSLWKITEWWGSGCRDFKEWCCTRCWNSCPFFSWQAERIFPSRSPFCRWILAEWSKFGMNKGIVSSRLLWKLATLSGLEVVLGSCPIQLSLLSVSFAGMCCFILKLCIKYSFSGVGYYYWSTFPKWNWRILV